ncbi:MAG: Uma2 family endonuclease, partial [Cyanobacteria bacterium]|nr:Uma2 family endonuclease [Cyanobacteriota bacterium]
PFNSDTKVRIRLLPGQIRFYYPDVSVICHQNSQDEHFQDEPVIVIEVLSKGSRRIDQGEKKDAYLTIPSLLFYVLVEQESPLALVWRRTEHGFVCEEYKGLTSEIPFSELDLMLPLAELYEGVEFSSESDVRQE